MLGVTAGCKVVVDFNNGLSNTGKDAVMDHIENADTNVVKGNNILSTVPVSIGEKICDLRNDFCSSVMGELSQPAIGMFFSNLEDAYMFYKEYSCKVGFGITRRSSHNFHGFKYHATFCCNKNRPPVLQNQSEGFALRNRGSTATGCRARIVVRDRLLSGKWVVEEVVLDHNHELFPDSVRLIRCHRSLPAFVKKQLEINEVAGLAQNKSINAIFTQAGGVTRCMFTERDMRNFISDYRRLQFGKGDAVALRKYFREQQVHCPNFFYSCDIGDDGHLKSVFWADGRSRAAYSYFGDVITFDSTYLTNRYRMPFALFVGVNHHGQSILLGCALLANELCETYIWLFETFLDCMSGKAPGAIITDQCASICGAVGEVFPCTRHRLCLWHIMKKVPEKLGGVKDREEIIQAASRAVYDSRSVGAFEKAWLAMLAKFQFGSSHKWFAELFDMRAFWVPAYVKSEFWAGMSTTQRSEGMNAFFDGYVNSRTTLKAFVEKYSCALFAKWEKEKQEDFRSSYRKLRFVSSLKIESVFGEHYTHRMFYIFQKEVKMLIGCLCHQVSVDNNVHTYIVHDSSMPGCEYSVRFYAVSLEYDCDCKLFLFRGLVCRHGLCVYKQVGVENIPAKYILDRWRKDFVRLHVMQNVSLPVVYRDVDRYDNLFKCVQQVMLELVEVGSRDPIFAERLRSGVVRFGRELLSTQGSDSNVICVPKERDFNSIDSDDLKDPVVVSAKGRPRTQRLKSSVEKKFGKRSCGRKRKTSTNGDQLLDINKADASVVASSMSATELLLMFSNSA